MAKKFLVRKFIFFFAMAFACLCLQCDESLFSPSVAKSRLAQDVFSFIERNREKIIEEWIRLTEIPAPSGYEQKRAEFIRDQFEKSGLDEVSCDPAGNVCGLWKGSGRGRKVIISAHLDTVFQGVWEIKARKEGNLLKAPGIGDNTASLINLLWSIRALKQAGFRPKNSYHFIATVGEEVGFLGMKSFLNAAKEKFDLVLALDGDLGEVHYGALGLGGGKIVFRGPGAHTMQSRGVPNPNLAVAQAVERIYKIEFPSEPAEKWTILNVGLIGGGRVRNAVAQESYFTIDLRSADQGELERVQAEIKRICQDIASKLNVDLEINLKEDEEACQVPGARESFLVKTVIDILNFLKVRDVELNPLGSTEANVGMREGILSVNLGRTYGRSKHSLNEEVEIEALFLAMKQILLLVFSLE